MHQMMMTMSTRFGVKNNWKDEMVKIKLNKHITNTDMIGLNIEQNKKTLEVYAICNTQHHVNVVDRINKVYRWVK